MSKVHRGTIAAVSILIGSVVSILTELATDNGESWIVLIGLGAAIAFWAAWEGWRHHSQNTARTDVSQRVTRIKRGTLVGWRGNKPPEDLHVHQKIDAIGPGANVTGVSLEGHSR